MNIHYNKNFAQLNGNSLFSGKNFAKLDDWNQSTTQKGQKKLSIKWKNHWINVVFNKTGYLFITFDKEIIHNKLKHMNGEMTDVLFGLLVDLIFDFLKKKANEPKAWEDMKQHEKLAEIGKNENIKYNKQINKFGDGYDC